MLFANDMVYMDKIKREINVKLEIWRDTLRSKGFPLNKTKIEYMKCKFSKSKKKKKKGVLRLNGQEILKSWVYSISRDWKCGS